MPIGLAVIAGGLGAGLSGTNLYLIKSYDAEKAANEFAMLGGGSAAIAAMGIWSMGLWYYKQSKGDVEMKGLTEQYSRMMKLFWSLMVMVYILTLVIASMDMHFIIHPNDVSVDFPAPTDEQELKGSYADALFYLSIVDIAMVGLAAGVFGYAKYGTDQTEEPDIRIKY